MYHNFCEYHSYDWKIPPFSIHSLATISNSTVYHFIFWVHTCTFRWPNTRIDIDSQKSSILVDDLRRFTEIVEHLLSWREGGGYENFQLSWKLDPIDLTQIDCEAVYDSYQYKFYMYIAIVCGFCFLFFFGCIIQRFRTTNLFHDQNKTAILKF